MLSETELASLEAEHVSGFTSLELLAACERCGVQMSEASLRKYVQLGLLPRSIRIGRKGKHRGSLGVYPKRTLRQLLRIKEMMAAELTIDEIKSGFLFVRSDIEQLEETLGVIFQTLASVIKARSGSNTSPMISRDVRDAKRVGVDLLGKLTALEGRLARVEPGACRAGVS